MGRATRWFKGLFGMKKDRDSKDHSNSGDRKDKNLSCPGRSRREPNNSPAEASWLKSVRTGQSEEEQNKHAIAVAAATAAAADAAVAAAQAAVAVVRLTSQGRGATVFTSSAKENLAAIKIQSAFRAYLSRKALRALKGLVKLQALVRGYLVRKQAAATLHGFEALVRAQSRIRAQKSRGANRLKDERFHSQFHPRRSIERFDETRSDYTTSIHSRRLSTSFENPTEATPKIVEVDPGRPKSRSRRANTWAWALDSGEYPYAQTPVSPHPPHQFPARLSIPSSRNLREFEWAPLAEECLLSTAQSTPRFVNSYGSSNGYGCVTPSKSVCMDRSLSNHPNYMASTKSFKAKLRSHSAPKQRPDYDGIGSKNRTSLNQVLESRNRISCGIRIQTSSSQAQDQEATSSFKNVVVGRLGRSSEINW